MKGTMMPAAHTIAEAHRTDDAPAAPEAQRYDAAKLERIRAEGLADQAAACGLRNAMSGNVPISGGKWEPDTPEKRAPMAQREKALDARARAGLKLADACDAAVDMPGWRADQLTGPRPVSPPP